MIFKKHRHRALLVVPRLAQRKNFQPPLRVRRVRNPKRARNHRNPMQRQTQKRVTPSRLLTTQTQRHLRRVIVRNRIRQLQNRPRPNGVRNRLNVKSQNRRRILHHSPSLRESESETESDSELENQELELELEATPDRESEPESESSLPKTPDDKYRSPRSQTTETITASETSRATCIAAHIAPPLETPQKIPSSRANLRIVSSACGCVTSITRSTRAALKISGRYASDHFRIPGISPPPPPAAPPQFESPHSSP